MFFRRIRCNVPRHVAGSISIGDQFDVVVTSNGHQDWWIEVVDITIQALWAPFTFLIDPGNGTLRKWSMTFAHLAILDLDQTSKVMTSMNLKGSHKRSGVST